MASLRNWWAGDPARRGTASQRLCRLVVLFVIAAGTQHLFGRLPYYTDILVLFVVLLADAHSEGCSL